MNRTMFLAVLTVLTVGAMTTVSAGTIDDELAAVLREAPADQPVSALVFLADRVDVNELNRHLTEQRASKRARHEIVVRSLQERAETAQRNILIYLAGRKAGGGVRDFTPLWIDNSIVVDALPAEIETISQREDVRIAFFNYEIESINPVGDADLLSEEGEVGNAGDITIGLIAVRAPEVWDLGFTGEGILVATLDTGVDGNHPALASRWRGVADERYANNPEWAWFDPVTNTTFPVPFGSHGTHTMGTVCGGPPGEHIGVAPGAQWIHAAVIDRVNIPRTVEDAKLAFEWMLDPDGDPQTNWDVPHVCSNSWRLTSGHGYPPCDETFWEHLDACEAAGITILFSAGNEGPGARTIGRPPDRATDEYLTCAVGAVDANNPNWPIAGFSSRGPSNCTPNGQDAIKPEISAPGVNVRSSVPGGGYAQNGWSGTSMASPHINGAVALILQANPELSGNDVRQIIYDTAFDLGANGNDNNYGFGMLDVFAAVEIAMSLRGLQFEFPNGQPETIDPNGGTRMRVVVLETEAHQPQPGTGSLHYWLDPNWIEIPMDEIEPNVYDAVFPAYPCLETILYYVSAEDTLGEISTDPFNAPDAAYSAFSLSEISVFLDEDFENPVGYTVSGDAVDGQWEAGVPVNCDRGDPPSDFDGSGGCYLTDNDANNCNSDVDGGATILTSPIFDLSGGGDPYVSYARWLSTTGGVDDFFGADISNDGGSNWVNLETLDTNHPDTNEGWFYKTFHVADFVEPTDQVVLRWTAADLGSAAILEAAVDALLIEVYECVDSTVLLPEELTIVRGRQESGKLSDLYASDDSRMVFQPGLTQNPDEPPVWLQLTGTSTSDAPGQMSFTLETQVDTPGVTQTVSLFNYDLQEFEEVDSRTSTNTDSVALIIVKGDPSRFIDPETLEVRAEMTWRPPPLVLHFPWNVGIDQAIWRISE